MIGTPPAAAERHPSSEGGHRRRRFLLKRSLLALSTVLFGLWLIRTQDRVACRQTFYTCERLRNNASCPCLCAPFWKEDDAGRLRCFEGVRSAAFVAGGSLVAGGAAFLVGFVAWSLLPADVDRPPFVPEVSHYL